MSASPARPHFGTAGAFLRRYNVALGSTVWRNGNKGGGSLLRGGAAGGAAGVGGAAGGGRVGGRRGRASTLLAQAVATKAAGGSEADEVLLTISTGEIVLGAAVAHSLPFRLLLTPVRGAGQPRAADFDTRYRGAHLEQTARLGRRTGSARSNDCFGEVESRSHAPARPSERGVLSLA